MSEVQTEEVPAVEDNSESGNNEDQAQAPEDQPELESEDEESNPNHEAAKWRHKFRDEQTAHKTTQEALTTATGQVEALQRQHVEAMLTVARVKPAALWATTDLTSLLSEDGTVDADAVQEAIGKAREKLGIQPLGKGSIVAGIGSQPSRTPESANPWKDAFAPKGKR